MAINTTLSPRLNSAPRSGRKLFNMAISSCWTWRWVVHFLIRFMVLRRHWTLLFLVRVWALIMLLYIILLKWNLRGEVMSWGYGWDDSGSFSHYSGSLEGREVWYRFGIGPGKYRGSVLNFCEFFCKYLTSAGSAFWVFQASFLEGLCAWFLESRVKSCIAFHRQKFKLTYTIT